jgi:hypothetical protein
MDLVPFRVPTIEEIKQARKKRVVIYMLTVFGDESQDGKMERVFAVAGVAASQKHWDEFYPVWKERLGGKIFHASDFEAGQGEFKGMSVKERKKLYKDLVTMIAESNIFGFGIAIDIPPYRKLFPDAPEYICYYMCFVPLIFIFTDKAGKIDPDQKAKFYFHHNDKTDHNSLKLYDHMINFPEVEFSSYFGEVSIADQEQAGIQCADLFAREVMKDALNRFRVPKGSKRETRKSFQALLDTFAFGYDYYDRDHLLSFKQRFEESRQLDDLSKWLEEHNLVNNIENRIKWAIHLRDVTKPNKEN